MVMVLFAVHGKSTYRTRALPSGSVSRKSQK
jgi:hypothetical protein